MSSRSNSESEDEDAYDLLARIKKQLNKDGEEDDDNDDSDEADSQEDQDSKNQKSDQSDNKSDDEENNNNSNSDADADIKKENKIKEEKENQKQSLANNNEEKQQKISQNEDDEEDDDDNMDSGLNINSILQQNGIKIEDVQDAPVIKQQKSKVEEAQQIEEVENKQIDISLSSSSSSLNSPTRKQESREQEQKSASRIDANKQKENVFTVVRVEAEKKDETIDHILSDLNNIKRKRALLDDPEIVNFKIDSSPLEQTIEQVKKKYDENVGKYMIKQKGIFDKIKETSKRSAVVFDQVNTSNKVFLKKKISDKDKYVKEIQKLQNESNKTKTFLLMMIQRLESIEHDIDKFTDTKLKQINALKFSQEQQQKQQQMKEGSQENNQQ